MGMHSVVRWVTMTIVMSMLGMTCASAASAEVTGSADNLRTSWYPDEPSLAPSVVGGGHFEKAFGDSLTGQIYAQPLVANGVLLVVTEDDVVYGINPITGGKEWERKVGTPVNALEPPIECSDLQPHIGITGAPVIDTEHNVAYFVANEILGGKITWRMHAISLASGEEITKTGFPVTIEGHAQNLSGVTFQPAQELQRPALLMMNGVIYAGFGSHCDKPPFQGWIAGVSTAGQLKTLWATSANGASIWQAGGGLVSDGPGRILFSSGNGSGSAGENDPKQGPGSKPPEGRLGESVVHLEVLPEGNVKAVDFFSPFNNKQLDESDIDLGSSAPVALPSEFATRNVPRPLVQEGKYGTVYLLNRDNLGGMGQGAGGKDGVPGELGPYGGVWGAASVWPGSDARYVYVPAVSEPATSNETKNSLRFLKYEEDGSGNPRLTLAASTAEDFWFGSGSPIVTSNGTAAGSGVLWITECSLKACAGEGELRAYAAVPGGGTPKPFWSEKVGAATKFSRPDASGGHIYVGNHEGHILAFSGPILTPSTQSLALGTTRVGGELKGQVTFTNTGTRLKITGEHLPSGHFEVTGLPGAGEIAPGQTLTANVAFESSTPGSFIEHLELTTAQGGTIKVALSATAEAPHPALTPSSGSLELGSTTVGHSLAGQVTFTNTGNTLLQVQATHPPSAPFTATGMPEKGMLIEPGQAVTVDVAFEPSGLGSFGGSLSLQTQAGETSVALSGTAVAPPEPTSPVITSPSLLSPPVAPSGLTAEPPPTLTNLKLRASASRLSAHRRKLVLAYFASSPGTVAVAVYHRVVSHRCQHTATCVRLIATKIKLKVLAHEGNNALTVALGTIAAGDYRLTITPSSSSGVLGVTRHLDFRTSH
jgi:outer membrane protein assembly factor BamB